MVNTASTTSAAEPAVFDNPEPMRLSPGEMAVLFKRLLGNTPAAQSALLADLPLKAEDLQKAEDSLSQRGLLIKRPGSDDAILDPPLFLLFNAVTRPEVLAVLQITRPGQPPRNINFSWRGGWVVRNHVDDKGDHLLAPIASPEALAAAILRECGLDPDAAANGKGRPAGGSAIHQAEFAALAAKASLQALLMLVTDASSRQARPKTIAWLVSDGQVWLMARSAKGRAALAPTTAANLRGLLVAVAQQVESGPQELS